MKRNYLIIMRNGALVKRLSKSTSVVLNECEQGYWLDSII